MSSRTIKRSAEFGRIASLPRRQPSISEEHRKRLEDLLRTPNGTMGLRPVQALALHDIGTVGGLCGPIRVGGGKTLISLLAPYVLDLKRPLLLLPAALIEKTERERRVLMGHWRIPRNIRLMSYESLGRVSAANELSMYRPDGIICDEAHRLKNPRAACTRRVMRYLKEFPDTKVIQMSGTLMKHSIKDFAPLCVAALKESAPVPHEWGEIEEWSNALDENVNWMNKIDPGPLDPDGTGDIEKARLWYRDRLLATPGVVSTPGEQVSCSLLIRSVEYSVNPITEKNFTRLRSSWERPDGWAFSMATEVYRCARELALGLHYRWRVDPPKPWLEARREWASFVRERIKDTMHSEKPLDSELQVANAVDAGDEGDGGLLTHWRGIKPTYTIEPMPVWHDDSALKVCEHWMKHPGIVWCAHTFFAEELAKRTGLPYYGAGGVDKKGNPIESENGKRAIIASVAANSTGRNLQMFDRNLITCAFSAPDQYEQLIGRTHRDGQQSDEVEVDILFGCKEHGEAFNRALTEAKRHQETLGQPQKLLLADLAIPASILQQPL